MTDNHVPWFPESLRVHVQQSQQRYGGHSGRSDFNMTQGALQWSTYADINPQPVVKRCMDTRGGKRITVERRNA